MEAILFVISLCFSICWLPWCLHHTPIFLRGQMWNGNLQEVSILHFWITISNFVSVFPSPHTFPCLQYVVHGIWTNPLMWRYKDENFSLECRSHKRRKKIPMNQKRHIILGRAELWKQISLWGAKPWMGKWAVRIRIFWESRRFSLGRQFWT